MKITHALYLVSFSLLLTFCSKNSEKQTASNDVKHIPNPKAVALNDEVTGIIQKVLFNQDTLNVTLLNKGLEKLDEAIALDSQYYYSYLNKATIYKTLGHPENALEEYKNAARYETNNPELLFTQGLIYEKINTLDSANDYYFKAIRLYNNLISKNPDSTDLKINRAFLFLFTHGKEDALNELNSIEPKSESDKQKINVMIGLISSFQRENYVNDF